VIALSEPPMVFDSARATVEISQSSRPADREVRCESQYYFVTHKGCRTALERQMYHGVNHSIHSDPRLRIPKSSGWMRMLTISNIDRLLASVADRTIIHQSILHHGFCFLQHSSLQLLWFVPTFDGSYVCNWTSPSQRFAKSTFFGQRIQSPLPRRRSSVCIKARNISWLAVALFINSLVTHIITILTLVLYTQFA